jgi:transcriptional regulator with XRE-family HTH domain
MNGTGPDAFGQWLDLTMSNRGIKGRALAKTLKVHESAVSRWRAGNGVPSMDSCLRLGKYLDVEPIRLAATAGLIDGELAGVDPLPLPEPTAYRKAVKEQILAIKGLTQRERQKLLDTYDEFRNDNNNANMEAAAS